MRRRSRTRRALKWGATAVFVITSIVLALSGFWTLARNGSPYYFSIANGRMTVICSWHYNAWREGWYVASVRNPGFGWSMYWNRIGRNWSLFVPLWPIVLAASVPTVYLWWLDRCCIPRGHCQHCGYDLTGNVSGVCPECRTAVTREGETR